MGDGVANYRGGSAHVGMVQRQEGFLVGQPSGAYGQLGQRKCLQCEWLAVKPGGQSNAEGQVRVLCSACLPRTAERL